MYMRHRPPPPPPPPAYISESKYGKFLVLQFDSLHPIWWGIWCQWSMSIHAIFFWGHSWTFLYSFRDNLLYPYKIHLNEHVFDIKKRTGIEYTLQREVTLNFYCDILAGKCWLSSLSSYLSGFCNSNYWAWVIKLKSSLEIAMPFVVANDCLNTSPQVSGRYW